MSALDEYHSNIVEKLQTAITDFHQVEMHYGIFNVDEIMRRVNNSPAAFVAIPTLKPGCARSDGRITFLAEPIVVIVSAHIGPPPEGDAPVVARRLLERVLKLARWNAFGSGMPPTEIEGNELHYDKLDPQGLALCVASWTQEILLDREDAFFNAKQSRMSDFSFPPLPGNAPEDVQTNETATTKGPDLRGLFDKGVI